MWTMWFVCKFCMLHMWLWQGYCGMWLFSVYQFSEKWVVYYILAQAHIVLLFSKCSWLSHYSLGIKLILSTFTHSTVKLLSWWMLKMYRHVCGGTYCMCKWARDKTKSAQRVTITAWCQFNLSIVSCLLSCSKLWAISIDQRKNLLPLTFDSSIDHFLLYTVKEKYSDSTLSLGSSVLALL